MNETMQVIKSRRSFRTFKQDQIKDESIEQILDAAIYAPSAMNQQKWHFTVVQNKELLNKMALDIRKIILDVDSGHMSKMASNPNFHVFYNAPTVIVISTDEKARWNDLDCGLAAQNIVLAAESLNIGSCIIAASEFLFASDKGNQAKNEIGLPEGYRHICSIALGYKPEKQPSVPPRNRDVINFVK